MRFLIKRHFLDINNSCSKLLNLNLKSHSPSNLLSTVAAVYPTETDQERKHIISNLIFTWQIFYEKK